MTNNNQERILVTGADGFLGSWLTRRLLKKNVQIRVFGRNFRRLQLMLGKDFNHLEVVEGNLLDQSVVEKAVSGCRHVFHLAAVTGRQNVEAHPIDCLNTNLLGTKLLVENSRLAGVESFIFTSSIEVERRPMTVYGISKLGGEAYVRYGLEESDSKYLILRLANTFGPGQSDDYVIPIFINKILKGENLVINQSYIRPYVFVEDMIEKITNLSDRANNQKLEVVCGQKPVSVSYLADKIKKILNGKRPKTNFEKNLTKTIDYYRQQSSSEKC